MQAKVAAKLLKGRLCATEIRFPRGEKRNCEGHERPAKKRRRSVQRVGAFGRGDVSDIADVHQSGLRAIAVNVLHRADGHGAH